MSNYRVDHGLDVAVVRIGFRDITTQKLHTSPNAVILEYSQTGIVGVAVDSVRLYNDVMVANNVYIFGYPVSLGLPHIPQLDFSRPLL